MSLRLIVHNSPTDVKFIASGREDVDVRMLGRGRPFALEVADPEIRDPSDKLLEKVEAEVTRISNGRIRVTDLQAVKRADVTANLKDEEKEKRKKYSAVCSCSRLLTPDAMDVINRTFEPIILQQKTPIRVLHRRPLAVRPRTIFQLELQPIPSSDRTFSLTLVAESGTYIKEFVHSDFGRTNPSLSHVIGDCTTDILSLDVEEVFVDWPPARSSPLMQQVA